VANPAVVAAAGNRAVTRLLQRDPKDPHKPPQGPKPPGADVRELKLFQMQQPHLKDQAPDPELAKRAREYRVKRTNLSDKSFGLNVAVVKYKRRGRVYYKVVANDPAKLHSETRAIKAIAKGDPTWKNTEILEVFTERHPCSNCGPDLQAVNTSIKNQRAARKQPYTDFRVYYAVPKWEPGATRAADLREKYLGKLNLPVKAPAAPAPKPKPKPKYDPQTAVRVRKKPSGSGGSGPSAPPASGGAPPAGTPPPTPATQTTPPATNAPQTTPAPPTAPPATKAPQSTPPVPTAPTTTPPSAGGSNNKPYVHSKHGRLDVDLGRPQKRGVVRRALGSGYKLGGTALRGAGHAMQVWSALGALGNIVDSLSAFSGGGIDSATRKVIAEFDDEFPSVAAFGWDKQGRLSDDVFRTSAEYLTHTAGNYIDDHDEISVPPAERADEDEIISRIGYHVAVVERHQKGYTRAEQVIANHIEAVAPLAEAVERHHEFVAEVSGELFHLAEQYAAWWRLGEELLYLHLAADHAMRQYGAIGSHINERLRQYDKRMESVGDLAAWADQLMTDWGPRWEARGRRKVGTN
jgi:hypothetical protein